MAFDAEQLAQLTKLGISGLSKLNPLTAGLSALPSISKGIYGLTQLKKASAMAKGNIRPESVTPESVQASTDLARTAYLDPRLPGQEQAQDRNSAAVANAVTGAGQIGGGAAGQLAALNSAIAGQQQGNVALGVAAGQQQAQDRRELETNLGQQGMYEKQNWDWNNKQKYIDTAEAASAEKQAGLTNVAGTLDNIAATALSTDFSKKGGTGDAAQTGIAGSFGFKRPPGTAAAPATTTATPTVEAPSITMNPDGSFPNSQLKKGSVNWSSSTNPLASPSPVAPGSGGLNFGATGGPLATPITPPAETQTFDTFNTGSSGLFNTKTPAITAPANSLFPEAYPGLNDLISNNKYIRPYNR